MNTSRPTTSRRNTLLRLPDVPEQEPLPVGQVPRSCLHTATGSSVGAASLTVVFALSMLSLTGQTVLRGSERASLAEEVLTQNSDALAGMPADARQKLQSLIQRDPGVWKDAMSRLGDAGGYRLQGPRT